MDLLRKQVLNFKQNSILMKFYLLNYLILLFMNFKLEGFDSDWLFFIPFFTNKLYQTVDSLNRFWSNFIELNYLLQRTNLNYQMIYFSIENYSDLRVFFLF